MTPIQLFLLSIVFMTACKILLEAVQMLCSGKHILDPEDKETNARLYKMAHKNHPVTKWIRESKANFLWALTHGVALYQEKLYRTGNGHKSIDVLSWALDNIDKLSFPNTNLTKFAIAISEDSLCRKDPQFDESDPVSCYKLYYKYDKSHIAKWTNRNVPNFMS